MDALSGVVTIGVGFCRAALVCLFACLPAALGFSRVVCLLGAFFGAFLVLAFP
ncbi:hypothetical protein PQQ63_09305 [Paraburkholderia metrosideri]|uniref:Uncharacterized protein n=1 Tax=Paraburkholderia metrosideri TaxID=580937 RepID=A0ABW9DPA2_9BURK